MSFRLEASRIGVAAAAALVLTGCETSSLTAPRDPRTAHVATAVVASEFIPLAVPFFNTCTGRSLLISGTLHIVHTATSDASGGTHTTSHGNFQNVSGVDLVTGDQYRAISALSGNSNINATGQRESRTFSVLKLVGQGPANNTTFRIQTHLTTNANGTVTASFSEVESTSCT